MLGNMLMEILTLLEQTTTPPESIFLGLEQPTGMNSKALVKIHLKLF